MVPRRYMLMVPHFKSGNTVIPHVHKYDSHLPNLESVWREPATRNNFNWSEKKTCGSQESSMTFFWGDLESQKLGSFETLGPQKQLVSPLKTPAPGENPYSYIPLTLGYRSIHVHTYHRIRSHIRAVQWQIPLRHPLCQSQHISCWLANLLINVI